MLPLTRELLDAAARGSLDEVKTWLNHGGSADAECQGMTLLIASALGGQKAVVLHLIEQGASLDMQDRDGMTALMTAAERNHAPVVAGLLKARAALEAQDADGETALMIAATKGSVAVAHMLLRAGASAAATNIHGETVLELASSVGCAAVVKMLSAGAGDVDRLTRALVVAAVKAHTSTVAALLRAGARADETDAHGMSALQAAQTVGDQALVDLMQASLVTNDHHHGVPPSGAPSGTPSGARADVPGGIASASDDALTATAPATIESLLPELLHLLFVHLPPVEGSFSSAAATCRRWASCARSEELWLDYCRSHWLSKHPRFALTAAKQRALAARPAFNGWRREYEIAERDAERDALRVG